MSTNPSATFTFPSGETVDLPSGMTACRTAGNLVTVDVNRFAAVGRTPAGREVRSHFSCAAYARAGNIYDMRASVERLRVRADDLERGGFITEASNLRAVADRHEASDKVAVAEWAADPAPCTCPVKA